MLGPDDDVIIRWDAASDPHDEEDSIVTARFEHLDMNTATFEEPHRVDVAGLPLGGEVVLSMREIAPDRPFGRVVVYVSRPAHAETVTLNGVRYQLGGSVSGGGWAVETVDLSDYNDIPVDVVGEDCASSANLSPLGIGAWAGGLVGRTSEHTEGSSAAGADIALAVVVAGNAPVTLNYVLPWEDATLTVWDEHCMVPVAGPTEGYGQVEVLLSQPGRYVAVLDSMEAYDPEVKRPPGMPFTFTVAEEGTP